MTDSNSQPVEITTKNTVSLTLGIVATVIGVVALLVGWIPFLGLFALPIAIIGLLLALAGIIVALGKKGKGVGLPVLGFLICLSALILPILSTGGASAALTKAMNDARTKQTEDAKVAVVPKGETGTTPVPATENEKPASPAPEPPKIVWNDAKNALRLGDVEVQITGLKVGKVAVKDLFGTDKQSTDDLLTISVEVSNTSTGKKIDFRSWQAERMEFDGVFAALTDNNENTYKRINFGAGTKISGSVGDDSIYPGKSVTDILVFEKPVDTAKLFHLELPGKNFNSEGILRFEIPATMISQ